MTTKTYQEVQDLKYQWELDPCWDIEETEGFEDRKEELLAYRLQKEADWTEVYNRQLLTKADELGIPGNIKLAQYVIRLESRIEKLENI